MSWQIHYNSSDADLFTYLSDPSVFSVSNGHVAAPEGKPRACPPLLLRPPQVLLPWFCTEDPVQQPNFTMCSSVPALLEGSIAITICYLCLLSETPPLTCHRCDDDDLTRFRLSITGPGLGIQINEALVRSRAEVCFTQPPWRNATWRGEDGSLREW